MKGAQIAQTLSRTLTSTTLDRASRQLQSMRGSRGFTVELLVVTDSSDYPPAVRQSAVIYLKNAVQDHCTKQSFIPPEDLADLKANLLEAIIRNVNNKQIAPTLREVVFQMAEKYYPREWPQIVEEALGRLTNASEFHEILGCVEALRAVFLVFGGSVTRDIQLGNLCNRTILPLLGLASKLFQNFNQETSTVLLSVLKLFSTAIQFHMPAIIAVNIHNLMIFVKKVLDLDLVLFDCNAGIYHLKKTCLRLLFRLYQKHANPKITYDKAFAQNFHAKYTRSFVESLVKQVIADDGNEKSSRRRHMELLKMSLSCLAYVNRQSADAAILLMQHKESLIAFCLQKLKLNFNKTYQSFVDFRMRIQDNRVQLKEFFFSLMQCEAIPDQQSSSVAALLGLLLNWLQTGDAELKELALYIYAEMSAELHFLKTSVEENMTLLIVNYVRPLLGADQPILVRMRACNLLASYNYLDLPEGVLVELATSVYSCLLTNGGEKESYLRIYACNAFNGLLKYPSIVEFVRPHLKDILRIYTSLLEADVSIIKNFEDLLNLLEEEIAPFANDLVLLLINLFANYARQDAQAPQFSQGNSGEQGQDDDESFCQQDDNNNESIAKACISSIRQILQAEGARLDGKAREDLLGIVLGVFADRNQMYIEEGYNILNLLLYKLQGPPEENYYLFFKTIAYAILGLPPNFLQQLQRGSNFQRQYADILQNICVQPDNDLIQNSIGCLRNFIAKSPPQVLYGYRDECGNPFIQTLFRIVQQVHENEGGRHSQTDRLIVLTIYVTLVEYRVLEEKELSRLVSQILGWMQMEQEAVGQQGGFSSPGKFVYSAVYLQIILLAVHSYGRTVINQLNLSSLLQRVLELQANFKCDYELARVLIGVADLLQLHAISDQSIANALMRSLPDLICRACRLRQEGDNPLNDIDMDDEAEQEEDRLLGCDENSMMVGWQQKGATQKDLQLQEDEEDDNDWEEEFNKFYDSPLDKIDEIKWLENVLKGEGSPYCALLSTQEQEQLSLYFTNAPPKQ